MRIEVSCISLLLVWTLLGCQSPSVHPLPQGHAKGLVPQPQRVEQPDNEVNGRGMRCDGHLQLHWPKEWGLEAATDWMVSAGCSWERTEDASQADVTWTLAEEDLGSEGYSLTVSEDRVVMQANHEEGAFRAWTTLRQLMPPVCEQGCPTGFTLPAIHVEDHAYLEHRGLRGPRAQGPQARSGTKAPKLVWPAWVASPGRRRPSLSGPLTGTAGVADFQHHPYFHI